MYSILGISSRERSAESFGKLVLQTNQIGARLQAFKTKWPAHQFFLLSTCHRLELLCYGPTQASGDSIKSWLNELGIDQQEPYYAYWGKLALKHLFKVAAGLESIIPGDDQIVQQVKQAYQIATQSQTLSTELHGAIQSALMCAKQIRTNTLLNRGHQSVASAGIRLANETVGTFQNKTALIVGAGDTSVRSAQILSKQGAHLYFLNRTHTKAEALANTFQGKAIQVEDIPRIANALSLITLAIDASEPVHPYSQWLHYASQPITWIDFSMPAQLMSTTLPENHIHIDLYRIARRQEAVLDNRKAQIPVAELVIQQRVDAFIAKQAERLTKRINPSIHTQNPTYA